MVFLIGRRYKDRIDDEWQVDYVMDAQQDIENEMTYQFTRDINEAKKCYNDEELFEYLEDTGLIRYNVMAFEYPDDYFESIRVNEVA